MATKREHDDMMEEDDGEIQEAQPEPKRPKRQGGKVRQHQNSSIDPTWGQKYVFSNSTDATTIPIGEESDFEDDADAMAYLMSVRQEAHGIPHVLVAPRPQIGPQLPPEYRREGDVSDARDHTDEDEIDKSIYTNDAGDSAGYYEDGAYTAYPESYSGDEVDAAHDGKDDAASEAAVLDAYFNSIMDRYLSLRDRLQKTPPVSAVARLSTSHVTYARPFSRTSNTIKIWSQLLRNTDPHPVQVAQMSKDSVIHIIRVLLGGKFLRQGYPVSERTSQWLWALLARLPDRGGLNHIEISWLRDLGRRAVLLGRTLAEMAALRDELAENGLGVHEGVDASSSEEFMAADEEQHFEEEANSSSAVDEQPGLSGGSATDEAIPQLVNRADMEEGEVDEGEIPGGGGDDSSEGEAMDLGSDSEADQDQASGGGNDLEQARRHLLARVALASSLTDKEREEEAAKERMRINKRATLTMILSITGDFYGQRDLLEFREPFVGL